MMKKKQVKTLIALALIAAMPAATLTAAEEGDIYAPESFSVVSETEDLTEYPGGPAAGDYAADVGDVDAAVPQEQTDIDGEGYAGTEPQENVSGGMGDDFAGTDIGVAEEDSMPEAYTEDATEPGTGGSDPAAIDAADDGYAEDADPAGDDKNAEDADLAYDDENDAAVDPAEDENPEDSISADETEESADEADAAASDNEAIPGEPVVRTAESTAFIPGGEFNNEELFESYLKKNVFGLSAGQTDGNPQAEEAQDTQESGMTGGAGDILYERLRAEISAVAAGTRTDTVFTIPAAELLGQTRWTEEELGTAIVENGEITDAAMDAVLAAADIDCAAVLQALLEDCPEELYWYDTAAETVCGGYEITAVPVSLIGNMQDDSAQAWDGDVQNDTLQMDIAADDTADNAATEEAALSIAVQYEIEISGEITLSFPVAAPFADADAIGGYAVDPADVLTAKAATARAQEIISEATSLTDYEKLCAYREKICQMAVYNGLLEEEAAGVDGVSRAGEARQLSYVFDDDPATEASGRGYAAAFQYLFDRSAFKASLSCITVTGSRQDGTGSRSHTWNVVRMDDGMYYLADIAFCDTAVSGAKEEAPFLAGTGKGSPAEGYAFSFGTEKVLYVYDAETLEKYPAEQLTLAAENYVPAVLRGRAEEKKTSTKTADAGIVASGKCGTNLKWTLDSAGTLTITGKGRMDALPRFIGYTYNAKDGKVYTSDVKWRTDELIEKVKKVVLSNEVRSIGACAFSGCSNLRSVTIPDSVTDIGMEAFCQCSSLTGAAIPNSVTTIGSSAFDGCSSLASVTIPDSVTSLGSSAFSGCSSLTRVVIPNSITIIESNLFSGCSALTSVTIPNSVTRIDSRAFMDCSSLTSVTIPNSVGSIYDSVFQGCSSLTSIVIPSGVEYINESLFSGCGRLTSVSLPDSITKIAQYAFADCTSLRKVTGSGKRLQTIGQHAFRDCGKLEYVMSCINVSSIGVYTFADCRSLKNIKLSPSIKTIPTGAFRYCPTGITVDFYGTKAQWNAITIQNYNDPLKNAKKTFHGAKPLSAAVTVEFDDYSWPRIPNWYKGKPIYEYVVGEKPTPGVCARVYSSQYSYSTLAKGTDYTVRYSGNDKPGTAYAIVTGKGSYSGTVKLPYIIGFADVPSSHAFSDAVYWAYHNNITAGYSGSKAGLFGVNDRVTRGQVMMFLWRAAGRPNPKKKTQTFKDVPTSHSYYKAIQWGSEQGITAGYSSGNFGVDNPCTRGSIVTFMWRYAKKYKGAGNPAGTRQVFSDVPVTHNFFKSVQWAYENKVTTGYSDGRFGIDDYCTRGQCVTFLYRVLK